MAPPTERRAQDRLHVLTSTMRTFAEATVDLEHLLDVVAKNVTEILGDSCVLLEVSEDGKTLLPVAAHAVGAEALERVRALLDAEPFALENHRTAQHVLETRGALLVPEIDPDVLAVQTTSAYVTFQRELGVHSLLVVALHAHGKPLGLLTLTRYLATSPAFREADRELAQNLADHASLAIVNARLLGAERALRRAAEEATRSRRAADARFARLFDSGILGIVVGRLDGTIIDLNPYVESLLGYSREQIVSSAVPWARLTPPGWEDVDARAREQLATEGIAALREKEYLRADGTRVPVLLGSAVISDGPEILSFILDLTERRRALDNIARLRAERARDAGFRAVVEAAPDAIVVTDVNGHIMLVNGETERLFGHARAGLLHRPIEQLLPTVGREGVQHHGRRSDGAEFPCEMTESTLATEGGTLTVRAIRDVTARKLAEVELVRAKEATEAANRELEAFSYSVAHDLRAPLRGVSGFAQIALDDYADKLDDEGKSVLRQIVTSAKEMAALIEGLLRLARLTRTEPRREDVDLSVLARSIATRSLSEDPTRGSTELLVEDGLVAYVDPALVLPLLENLVGNAVKFTAKTAAPRIEVGKLEQNDGDRVFFVRDNGAGFDMAFAEKLFVPFQRLHATSEFAGTGIGLATAQRVVSRHGGRIWAEGRVGQGATFYFTLPKASSTPPSRLG